MFDPKSDYALNKKDPEAIVCPSATGVHIRLTRADFASEDEFQRWKNLSDKDYEDMEKAGRYFYDNCVQMDDRVDASSTISAQESKYRRIEFGKFDSGISGSKLPQDF